MRSDIVVPAVLASRDLQASHQHESGCVGDCRSNQKVQSVTYSFRFVLSLKKCYLSIFYAGLDRGTCYFLIIKKISLACTLIIIFAYSL